MNVQAFLTELAGREELALFFRVKVRTNVFTVLAVGEKPALGLFLIICSGGSRFCWCDFPFKLLS